MSEHESISSEPRGIDAQSVAWRILSAVVFIVAGLVVIPVSIYAALTLNPSALYLFRAFGGLCSLANGVRITRGLLRERHTHS